MTRRRGGVRPWVGWLAGLGLLGPATCDAGAARFFASAAQCENAGVLPAGSCRTAFANALAEFGARAPSYPSRRSCLRAFGPCMPWPIGTRRFSEFRPQWVGVSVDDHAGVTPAVAPGRLRLEFAPQSAASLTPAATAAAAPAPADTPAPRVLTPDDEGGDGAALPPPRAGGGFTVIDGVLTYPAPARFQRKALRQP